MYLPSPGISLSNLKLYHCAFAFCQSSCAAFLLFVFSLVHQVRVTILSAYFVIRTSTFHFCVQRYFFFHLFRTSSFARTFQFRRPVNRPFSICQSLRIKISFSLHLIHQNFNYLKVLPSRLHHRHKNYIT